MTRRKSQPASLGQRIREGRKAAGLNQDELAKKVGASGRRQIIRWEKGENVPTKPFREKLAQELGLEDLTPDADEALTPLYRRMEERLEVLEDAVRGQRADLEAMRELVEGLLNRLRAEQGTG